MTASLPRTDHDGNETMTSNTNDTSTAPAALAPRRSNWVLLTTSIVGGMLLIGVIAWAALAGIGQSVRSSGGADLQTFTADVSGITELDIDAAASNFSVVYDSSAGDDTALLEVQGSGMRSWNMNRDGAQLQVESNNAFSFGWFGFGPADRQTVVLHLPREMQQHTLDAELSLSSGVLSMEGEFGDLVTEVSAGEMIIGGVARSFRGEVSAGSLVFELQDVSDFGLEVSAGGATGEIVGQAPRTAEFSVSAGSAEVAMPNTEYRVVSDVSAGAFENLLRTDPATSRVIDVEVSAGELILKPGR